MAPVRLVDPHSRVGLVGVYVIIVVSMAVAIFLLTNQNERTDRLAQSNQQQLAQLKALRQAGIAQRKRADANLCAGLEDVKTRLRRIIKQSDAQVDELVKRLPGFTRQDAIDAHARNQAALDELAAKNCETAAVQ